MGKFRDLSNQTFGRLTAIVPIEKRSSSGSVIWQCRCECGNVVEVSSDHLARGHTQSCGCLHKEIAAAIGKIYGKINGKINGKIYGGANRKYPDGERKTNLYIDWCHMNDRCYNANGQDYHHYGGRGIEVCPEWISFEEFKAWSICNGFHEGCGFTLDRIDNDGDYTPDNCQWLTKSEHATKSNQDRKKKRESLRPGKQSTLDGTSAASA